MIQIARGAPPDTLAANAIAWTAEFLAALAAGQPLTDAVLRSRYAGEDVRTALNRDAFGKCMYCEGDARPTSYLHVEHIRPKGQEAFRDLIFAWNNLGLACQKCNVKKGATFDAGTPPVDPYSENPEEHLAAAWAFIRHRPGSARGLRTIDLVDLNRDELWKSRKERLDIVERLLHQWATAQDPAVKDWVSQQVAAMTSIQAPYAMVIRSHVRHLGLNPDQFGPDEIEGGGA